MRDLEELRRILDEAANLAAKAAGQTKIALVSIENRLPEREDELRHAKQLTEEMGPMHQRLGLRLGGDPLTATYGSALSDLGKALQGLEGQVFGTPIKADFDAVSDDINGHTRAYGRFLGHARARVGIDAAGSPGFSL
jgi:hypothetical protein